MAKKKPARKTRATRSTRKKTPAKKKAVKKKTAAKKAPPKRKTKTATGQKSGARTLGKSQPTEAVMLHLESLHSKLDVVQEHVIELSEKVDGLSAHFGADSDHAASAVYSGKTQAVETETEETSEETTEAVGQMNLFGSTPKPEPKEEKPTVSKDEMVQAMQALAASAGMEKAVEVAKEVGAVRISDIKEADYAKVYQRANELAAQA